MVHIALIHEKAGKIRSAHHSEDLFLRHGNVHADDVLAHGHDVLKRGLGEVHRIAEQIGLLLVQRAAVLHLVDDGLQLLLGHAVILTAAEQAGKQIGNFDKNE